MSDKFKLSGGIPITELMGMPPELLVALRERGYRTVEQVFGVLNTTPDLMEEFCESRGCCANELESMCLEALGNASFYLSNYGEELPCSIQEDLGELD